LWFIQSSHLKRHMTSVHRDVDGGASGSVYRELTVADTATTDFRNAFLAELYSSVTGSTERDRKDACTFCGKIFQRTGDLKRHIRSHTGEKPYKCDMCEMAFVQSAHLKRHQQRTHVTMATLDGSRADINESGQ
jgi:uncharacterized C2H2 Zn-finger protein